MSMALYQQGDVLFKSFEEGDEEFMKKLKPSNRSLKDGKRILVEGEQTGHSHAVIEEDVEIFEDEDGTLYMKVPKGKEATVVHEEHNQIQVPEGLWKIDQVQEYDHFAEEARRVID